MDQLPLVTVIVVSYNHGKYITENLDSIKNQTYSNIELIVADDASPDNSVEIFESWLENNNFQAKKNYHKTNTGLATVLNECIKIASGKYLKLIAADDFLHPQSIEKCVNKLEELDNHYGMVFTDFYAIDDLGENTDFFLNYENVDFFEEDNSLKQEQLIKSNCIIAPSVLIKKDVILSTGDYDSQLLLEDHHRWLMVNEKMKIHFINEKLVYYRVLPTSITGTRHNKMVEEDIYLKIKYDKHGINKMKVYNFILSKYQRNEKIPNLVLKEYYIYPFRTRSLSFALKNGINPNIYNKYLKIKKQLNS